MGAALSRLRRNIPCKNPGSFQTIHQRCASVPSSQNQRRVKCTQRHFTRPHPALFLRARFAPALQGGEPRLHRARVFAMVASAAGAVFPREGKGANLRDAVPVPVREKQQTAVALLVPARLGRPVINMNASQSVRCFRSVSPRRAGGGSLPPHSAKIGRMPGGVFISYRRQDAAAYARLLYERLSLRFGSDKVFFDVASVPVFFDVASVPPGADFGEYLNSAVADAEVILVVMGPQWLSATDASGRRRIDDPADFIRHELATAFFQNKRVVPVLVGGADMPRQVDLPDDLRGLVYQTPMELRDNSFEQDLEWFSRELELLPRTTAMRPSPGPLQPRGPDPGSAGVTRLSFLDRLLLALQVLLGRREPPVRVPVLADGAPFSASIASQPVRRHDIFISYSSIDSRFADQLVQALEQNGRICWIASRDIPPGVPSWAEPIVTAIANSRLCLVLLTKHSASSIDVMREVTRAADEKIPLLAAMLDGTPLSPGLRYFFVAGQRLDVAQLAPDQQMHRILPAVEQQL